MYWFNQRAIDLFAVPNGELGKFRLEVAYSYKPDQLIKEVLWKIDSKLELFSNVYMESHYSLLSLDEKRDLMLDFLTTVYDMSSITGE